MKNLIIPALLVGGAVALGGGKKKKKKKKTKAKADASTSDTPTQEGDKVANEGEYATKAMGKVPYRVIGNDKAGYYGEADLGEGDGFMNVTGANRYPSIAEVISQVELALNDMDKDAVFEQEKAKCQEFFESVYEPNPGPGELALKDVAVTQTILPALESVAQSVRTAVGRPLNANVDATALYLDTLNQIAPGCKISAQNFGIVYTSKKIPITQLMTDVINAMEPLVDQVISDINAKSPVLQGAPINPNLSATKTSPNQGATQN